MYVFIIYNDKINFSRADRTDSVAVYLLFYLIRFFYVFNARFCLKLIQRVPYDINEFPIQKHYLTIM